MENRVSIFVCGVQKGGTTSLHAHFSEHPGLLAPYRKEIHFFDAEDLNWAKPDYILLDQIFPPDEGRRRRFDITPIYGFWPPSVARIRDYNPDAKLIYLFRDPLRRAWSQWCMRFARREENLPFAEAIRDGRSRMDGLPALALERRAHSYVERGFYGEQARRALAHFPRENILFLRSQDLWNDHRGTLARIADFLAIEPFPDTGAKREYVRPEGAWPSPPTEPDRQLFADVLRDDLRQFVTLTGIDISDWEIAR
jgi:hypothetical protein